MVLTSPWDLVLTVVFVLTGLYSFSRWTRAMSTGGRDGAASGQGRVIELNHLLMSVAMVAMAWRPTGTIGTAAQIVIFAVFAVLFVVSIVSATTLAQRLGAATHLLMNAAMIWMLAAMPLLMGMSMGSGDGGGHAGHAGHGASGAEGMAPMAISTPGWASGVNVASIVVMAGVAAWWLVKSVRVDRGRLHHGCHALMGAGMGLMLAVMH